MCPNEPPIKIDALRVIGKSLILVFGGIWITVIGIVGGTIGIEMIVAILT